MSALSAVPEASVVDHAEEPHARNGLRAIFSFPVVLGALLVLLTMFTIRSRFSDPDMWWHLKTGELIWNTHSIPRVDPFSFTANGRPWVAQEWLSEWTMYGAWKLGGHVGLMVWFALIASLLILAGYLLCTLYSGNCKVAFLGGVTVWLFSTIGLAVRPQILAYLLLLGELLALELGRTRNARWLLAIPPIVALWINLHASYLLGLVVLTVVFFFSFVEFEFGLIRSTRWPREKRRMLTIVFSLSLLALLANPIGWKLIFYPVSHMPLLQSSSGMTAEEFQQISFSDSRGMALLALGALVLLIPMLRGIKLYGVELALVAAGFWLAVNHKRMLFVFGILAAPVLCRMLATAWDRYDPRRDNPLGAGLILVGIAVAVVLGFPSARNLEQQVEAGNPVKAVDFLKRSGLAGNMVNEYAFGGYLIWAAPEHKVAVDGRGDVYEPVGVLTDFARWALLEARPDEFLKKYDIQICLMSRSAPITKVLPLLPDWKEVYSDRLAVIYARQQQ